MTNITNQISFYYFFGFFIILYFFFFQGDSGSPLLVNNEVVGINESVCPWPKVSRNSPSQNLHVAVSYYQGFIESAIDCKKSDWLTCNLL